MSDSPCRPNPDELCKGADMASDHLETRTKQLYGDYHLTMRAPYAEGTGGGSVSTGVYAYFTAGFSESGGKGNEMNFGFHPDRYVQKSRFL